MKTKQAFPYVIPENEYNEQMGTVIEGITDLEYFAAKAMQAVVSNPGIISETPDEEIAFHSYNMAEAMIKERDKRLNK